MKEKKAVFMITNKYNQRRYVGISPNIEHEWKNICRRFRLGVGIRKMREDFELHGENGFKFEVILESEDDKLLHRKESELAYQYHVWQNGYNSEPLLNYNAMPEEKLALEKLKFYKLIDTVDDGKYMFLDLLQILNLDKNNLEILLREITDEEMLYFQKRIVLKNSDCTLGKIYIHVQSFEKKIDKL